MVRGLDELNFQRIRFLTRVSGKTCWFQLEMFYRSSFSLAIKLVPLSDHKTDGIPRRAVNLSIPITQLLVSMEGTTSKCRARVVEQVNRIPIFSQSIFSQKRRMDQSSGTFGASRGTLGASRDTFGFRLQRAMINNLAAIDCSGSYHRRRISIDRLQF